MSTRTEVKSSMATHVRHDGDSLEVTMKNGKVYRYAGVTAEDHAALIGAESFGGHFAKHIRGRFPHQDVTPAETNG